MKRVLVTYATIAGSTSEVAKAVGEEIARSGLEVDVLPLTAVKTIEPYAGVVVGGPMIAGWHRQALGFVARHRKDWNSIPLAVFITAMSLTRTTTAEIAGIPLCIDDKLPKDPSRSDRLTFRESYSRVEHYAAPIVSAARPAKPASIAFFGGRLEYGRLPWWAVIFALLIIQAPAGDRLNWPFIRSWAAGIPAMFHVAPAAEPAAHR